MYNLLATNKPQDGETHFATPLIRKEERPLEAPPAAHADVGGRVVDPNAPPPYQAKHIANAISKLDCFLCFQSLVDCFVCFKRFLDASAETSTTAMHNSHLSSFENKGICYIA